MSLAGGSRGLAHSAPLRCVEGTPELQVTAREDASRVTSAQVTVGLHTAQLIPSASAPCSFLHSLTLDCNAFRCLRSTYPVSFQNIYHVIHLLCLSSPVGFDGTAIPLVHGHGFISFLCICAQLNTARLWRCLAFWIS